MANAVGRPKKISNELYIGKDRFAFSEKHELAFYLDCSHTKDLTPAKRLELLAKYGMKVKTTPGIDVSAITPIAAIERMTEMLTATNE